MPEQHVNITIDVVVKDSTDAFPYMLMLGQLSQIFNTMALGKYGFHLKCYKTLESVALKQSTNIVIVSMLGRLNQMAQSIQQDVDQYSHELARFADKRSAPTLVSTIFRSVPLSVAESNLDSQKKISESIARLNLMAVYLSKNTGVAVIDIDRCLAHYGARQLQAGFSLSSKLAAHLAGDTIVSTLLEEGLETVVSDADLQMARALHGDHLTQKIRFNNYIQQVSG